MGKTHTKKTEARAQRLKTLPQSERLLKSALIKKKEGRVLDASEKHALKMSSERGEILKLWEQLRTANSATAADESGPRDKKTVYEHKYPIVDRLLRLIEPSFSNLIKTPSVSRVLQSMIKYGSNEQVERIARSLTKDFQAYATDSFAHYVIGAAVRHASHELYAKLFTATIPCVPTLATHAYGIEVVHAMYSSRWCSPQEAQILLLAIFKDNVALMKKWVGYPSMEAVLKGNPALQKRLLTRLFDVCDKLVSQKGAIAYPFVQRLVYVYLRSGTKDEVSELCDTLRGLREEGGKKKANLATIALTREGAPLASLAFALTDPNKRKSILQNFSETLGELVANKYSAPVVARLFDLVYDPLLLRKYVVNDMVAHLGQVVGNPYGYLILLHLLTPRRERKDRFLLPNWKEHNLYSIENTEWNHHTWLTAHYEEEVVEISSHPAAKSHLAALPAIVAAFLVLVRDEEKRAAISRNHIALIAREILHVTTHEALYKAALPLTDADVQLLTSLAPALGAKRGREGEGDGGEAADEPSASAAASAKRPKREKENVGAKPAKAASSPKKKGTTTKGMKSKKA